MSIADNLAGPIANTATKAYVKRYDPNKPGFQLIFHKVWNDFLEAIKAFNISVPQYVKDEVARIHLEMNTIKFPCFNSLCRNSTNLELSSFTIIFTHTDLFFEGICMVIGDVLGLLRKDSSLPALTGHGRV